jgi:sugar lactone lactonase YvrE
MKKVQVFDYSLETGSISNGRTFVDTSNEEGVPDGLCMDAEGNVWVAFFGGPYSLPSFELAFLSQSS